MTEIEAYLASLSEKRRKRIEHIMQVIESAAPQLAARLQNGIIGFGHYHYRYASGRTGEWFMLGVASRARYISLYAAAPTEAGYLVEKFVDRMPGCTMGKACIEVPDSVDIDDEVLVDLTVGVVASFEEAFARPRVSGRMHIWE